MPIEAESQVLFFVPGKPAAQGSKRHVGGGRLIESSREVGPWRERVALQARVVMYGRELLDDGVVVDLTFVMPRPVSTPKRRTPAAIKRPDIDKMVRAIFDALTHVVFADDSQVVELHAHKRLADIGEMPGVHIEVLPWTEPSEDRCPCGCRYLDRWGAHGPTTAT